MFEFTNKGNNKYLCRVRVKHIEKQLMQYEYFKIKINLLREIDKMIELFAWILPTKLLKAKFVENYVELNCILIPLND